MAKKTDLIRVSQEFADAIRKASKEEETSIVDMSEKLTPTINRRKKKESSCDPFALHLEGL